MNSDPAKRPDVTRRTFLHKTAETATVGAAGLFSGKTVPASVEKPALLGGKPVHSGRWPAWPVTDRREETGLIDVLRSGTWYRYRSGGKRPLETFERQWAGAIGTSFCQMTANGTSALITSLAAMQIGPGDEVLVPPYTFIATINSVLLHHALPVFVDSDASTAMMDAEKIEERINGNTKAVIPVHIGGAPCQMDRVLAVANKHGLQVIEDACQAHTGEWKGRRVGSLGDAGCFSFQNSKNITSGEGGAVTTNDKTLFARAQAFHNNGQGFSGDDGAYTANGGNFRLTEFHGAILLEQLKRLDAQSKRREANGAYLNDLLAAIPGVSAKKTYSGTTRHGYHLYLFDYEPGQFAGLSKPRFLEALRAEGIPISGGYRPTNKMPFVEQFLNAPGFKRIYSRKRLKRYRDENHCPANDRLCSNTFWLPQNVLLGTKNDMEKVAAAIEKMQKNADQLA